MKNFLILYPRGYIELNINNYFVKASLPSIKKMFKLARLHSKEKYRAALLHELRKSKKYWDEMYHKANRGHIFWVDGAIGANLKDEDRLSPRIIELAPRTEKQWRNLQAKLDRVIEILNAEKWG